jgi:hypothetical protein
VVDMLEVLLRESVATSPNRADLGNGADLAEVAIKISQGCNVLVARHNQQEPLRP